MRGFFGFKACLAIATVASVAVGTTSAQPVVDAVSDGRLVVRQEQDAASQATALLASMPDCGVSWPENKHILKRIADCLTNSETVS